MAENPLLPNAELRALHALLKRAVTPQELVLSKPVSGAKAGTALGSEALLAGTLLQVREGDLVIPSEDLGMAAAALLHGETAKRSAPRPSLQKFPSASPRLLLAAGLAAAQRRSGGDRLSLAFAHTDSLEPQWSEALSWAQKDLLPLILICADRSGKEAFRGERPADPDVLAWTPFARKAGKLKLPILSVDGADPVAVYRVMQESILRARAQGGPAVLWAVLPKPGKGSRTSLPGPTPLERLEQYMGTRNISFA